METTLRVALARRRMSIRQLTEESGVSWEAISKVVDGVNGDTGVNVSTLRKIAEALGLKLVIRFEECQCESNNT